MTDKPEKSGVVEADPIHADFFFDKENSDAKEENHEHDGDIFENNQDNSDHTESNDNSGSGILDEYYDDDDDYDYYSGSGWRLS